MSEKKRVVSEPRFSRHNFESKLVAKALGDSGFRERFISDPTKTYAEELGRQIPVEASIRVVEETATMFYVVLPFIPPDARLSNEKLLKVAAHELTHRDPCWGVGDPIE